MIPRILIIDDDIVIARAIAAALGAVGGVVHEMDGEGAVARLARETFDLMVVDLHLPGMSGIEVIARVRKRHPNLPAILLTAQAQPADLIDAINRAHIYRFLAKPVNLDDLERTVRSALEAAELRRERERLHAELEERHDSTLALYEATRELSQATGRAAIVTAALSYLPRAINSDAAAVLLVPSPRRKATLYVHSVTDVGERALVALKESALSSFDGHSPDALTEDQVSVVLLGAPAAGQAPQTLPAESAASPLEVGGDCWGLVQLLRHARPYTADERRLLGVIASQTAQALRRDAELLLSQRRQLELLVRSMADGVLMMDEGGEVQFVNPAARILLGLDTDSEVLPEAIVERLGFDPFALLRSAGRVGGDFVREEVEHGGRYLHALVSPVLDASRTLAGVAVVLRDITADRELEARKDEFVSVVSHELRTPLASIAGSLDLVLRGYVGTVAPKQRHYLEMARSSCARLHAIVDDLLDLSKYESGRLEITFEPIDLPSLLVEVVERHRPAALGARVELAVIAQGDVAVAGDPNRLAQVLDNLLDNALKFTPRGDTVEVSLLASAAVPDHVGFRVWNTGSPIKERDLERIFEKFVQLAGSKRKPGGTGLGLAIARGLVEAHGGRLWAESDPTGVAFIAVLPRCTDDSPAAPVLDAVAVGALGSLPAIEPVLIIDHDPATARLLRGLLMRYNLSARAVTDVQEALDLLETGAYGLVLLEPKQKIGRRSLARRLLADSRTRGLSLLFTDTPGARAPRMPAVGRPLSEARLAQGVGRALNARVAGHRPLALVLERQDALRARLVAALVTVGFEVVDVSSGKAAREALPDRAPDLLVVDGDYPEGTEVARAFGAGQPAGPALFVRTAGSTMLDKVRAYGQGASDVIPRPTDSEALAERAVDLLRRRSDPGAQTATARLPGPHAIERILRQRLQVPAPLASLHVTLEDLGPYREVFGQARTDEVVSQTTELIREVLRTRGSAQDVAGHVGFAHFVILTEPERADAIGLNLLTSLERVLPLFCGPDDRARGYLTLPGDHDRAPLMSGCVVSVIDNGGRFLEPTEIYSVARAARDGGRRPGQSIYLRDEPSGITAKTEIGG